MFALVRHTHTFGSFCVRLSTPHTFGSFCVRLSTPHTHLWFILCSPRISFPAEPHTARVGQNRICIRCTYGTFGREIAKYTVIYRAYICDFLAGYSPNIRSYTVCIYTFLANPTQIATTLHVSGQTYTFLANPTQIAKYTVIYTVHTHTFLANPTQVATTLHVSGQLYTFLANPTRFWLTLQKLPNIRSYTWCIYMRFFGRIIAKYTVIYTVHTHTCLANPTQVHNHSGQLYTFLSNPTQITNFTVIYTVHTHTILANPTYMCICSVHTVY